MMCDECRWYWCGGLSHPQCHNENASWYDKESDGDGCPWYDDKDMPNEQIEPEDIWN